MAESKTIMLYLDTAPQWKMLSDEQAGKLIKALFAYAADREQLCTEDGMLQMAYSFIIAQIDRDQQKWNETCQKRAESARKRWGKLHTDELQQNANDASASECMQMNANNAHTETVTDTVTDTDTKKEINKEKSADKPRKCSRTGKQFVPPTVDEVRAYCQERQNGIDPQRFVDYYTANGWVQGNKSKPIRDWKATVRYWESKRKDWNARSPDNMQSSSIDMDEVDRLMNPGSSFDLSDFDQLVNCFPDIPEVSSA